MKFKILKIIFIFFLLLSPLFIYVSVGQPPPPPPEEIPIDGGLLALLIAGIAFGGVKIYKEEKKKRIKE